jgi:hypothetical protein
VAERIRDGESECGWGDPAHTFGPIELGIVEMGLFWACGGENDSIPCWNPRWMSDRQP